MSEDSQPFATAGSGKSPEEVAFDLVSKLKGQGVWGERNQSDILDMYAECLDAVRGLRAYEGQNRVEPPIKVAGMAQVQSQTQTQTQAQVQPMAQAQQPTPQTMPHVAQQMTQAQIAHAHAVQAQAAQAHHQQAQMQQPHMQQQVQPVQVQQAHLQQAFKQG